MTKFTQTFLYRIGAAFDMGDVISCSQYDLLAVQGFRWKDVNNDTWGELKKLNPNIRIFPYYQSRIMDNQDDQTNPWKNSLARWNISRGHSLGNCNTDNPDMFLYNAAGNRVNGASIHNFMPDWSNPKFGKYWSEAWNTDNLGKPWEADGVMIDEPHLRLNESGATSSPVNIDWEPSVISWIDAVSAEMSAHNTLIWINSGTTRSQEDIDAYIALDTQLNNLIYMASAEGAFVVGWGPHAAQFYPEKDWVFQVKTPDNIHRIRYGMQSFVQRSLFIDGVGTDNYGKTLHIIDAVWYGLCSYHLAKNTVDNNTYFSFTAKTYSDATYYDEYDINLGNAIDTFKVTNIGGNNIYYREFERGYVYVNPTKNNVSNIALPETCRQLTHTNFKNDPATIQTRNTINLVSHRGTFLLKSSVSPPEPPIEHDINLVVQVGATITIDGKLINPTTVKRLSMMLKELTKE